MAAVWERIKAVVARRELSAALAAITELAPAPDSDADEDRRALLVTRYATVRPFLALLTTVVDLGATPQGGPVLDALRGLAELMGRKKVTPAAIDTTMLSGSWRRHILDAPQLEPGCVDWKAYVFCVLEAFHRMLRRREIFARNSSKRGDPRADALDGAAWERTRPVVLTSLGLTATAAEHLHARAQLLDGTYKEVVSRLPGNAQAVGPDPPVVRGG